MTLDPAIAVASIWMDDWTIDEVISVALPAQTGDCISPEAAGFQKARDASMLNLTDSGWKVRDSTGAAAAWQIRKRTREETR